MLFDLTDDQVLLRDTTVRFVEGELPLERTRRLHDDPVGFDRRWLAQAAELGWFSMLVPPALGGGSISGDGLVDVAILAEVLGRNVQPGPFVPMNVVASAIADHGSPRLVAEVLPGIMAGEVVATWGFGDDRGTFDAGRGLRGCRDGDEVVLTGSRGFVQDAQSAEVVLMAATIDGAPVQVLVPTDAPGFVYDALVSLDLSRRFAHIHLDQVTVHADAVLDGGAAELEAQLDQAIVLGLAETVGAMDALFEMTVEYAKDRVAFGRPIGSFQAIKHALADEALYLETSKAAAVAAAAAVSADAPGARALVSMAAAFVGDQAHALAQECLQVHGGIGFTWEHDLHLFMRRIESNIALFGEPTWHRERVCQLHGLGARR